MSTQEAAYLEASKQSYANQEGGVTIPAGRLNEIVEIPQGFQPLGICSRPMENGDQIAIAAYNQPAICLAQVRRDDQGLHFKISWIRGVKHGIQRVRLFPDVLQPAGANRAQTVNFLRGWVAVSRNSERDFFLLAPVVGGWELVDKISFPMRGEYRMIHSALFLEDYFLTVESPGSLKSWMLCKYKAKNDSSMEIMEERKERSKEWRYGMAYRSQDDALYT